MGVAHDRSSRFADRKQRIGRRARNARCSAQNEGGAGTPRGSARQPASIGWLRLVGGRHHPGDLKIDRNIRARHAFGAWGAISEAHFASFRSAWTAGRPSPSPASLQSGLTVRQDPCLLRQRARLAALLSRRRSFPIIHLPFGKWHSGRAPQGQVLIQNEVDRRCHASAGDHQNAPPVRTGRLQKTFERRFTDQRPRRRRCA
jgi:hypothetical protein